MIVSCGLLGHGDLWPQKFGGRVTKWVFVGYPVIIGTFYLPVLLGQIYGVSMVTGWYSPQSVG